MIDLLEASSRAAVLLSKLIIRQQVIAAPGPGTVSSNPWPTVLINRRGSVDHPGRGHRCKVCSCFIWGNKQVSQEWHNSPSLSLLLLLLHLLPPPIFVSLRKNVSLWVPLRFYLHDRNFTDVQGSSVSWLNSIKSNQHNLSQFTSAESSPNTVVCQ